MKKILLATTILVATTGFAAAEISFGGTAKMGIAQNGTKNGGETNPDGTADDVFQTYSYATLDVTFTGETDSGLTFGADFGLTAGKGYYLADDDGFNDEDALFGTPSIYVDGSYGKLTVADDDIDFFDDATTDGTGDLQYEGTFGAFGVGLIADVDEPAFSTQLSYTRGALTASADYSEITPDADAGLVNPLWNVSLGYTFGSITATIGAENDGLVGDDVSENVKVAYDANGLGAYASYDTADDGNQWEIGGSFAKNGLSLAFFYDEGKNYEVTTSYDLGGGLSLEAGVNDTGDVMIGGAMSF